jgi:DNA-binding HxlR family transcriptional regulator/putative sterol carrier protein
MRSYGDPCGIARALDLVGERWALLLVRELVLGPKRFTDLRAGLPGASPNVLAQRLRELERVGVVRRRRLGPPVGSRVYELTDWGLELEPVLLTLGRWGSRSAQIPGVELGVDALMLALKSTFDPARAEGLRVAVEVRIGEEPFWIAVGDQRISVGRGVAGRADGVIEADGGTFRRLAFGRVGLDEAVAEGSVRVEGDLGVLRRFLTLFPVPAPVVTGGMG